MTRLLALVRRLVGPRRPASTQNSTARQMRAYHTTHTQLARELGIEWRPRKRR